MMPPAGLRANQSTDWLPQPDRYRWVFVDFQDVRLRSRAGLLRHILTGLALNIPAPCDLPDFMDVVSTELQGPAIILMDEIGTALTSSELDEELWWSFRSLGTNQTAGNLAFLLTAHEKPWFLAEEQGISSPFFNIFGHTFQLGPLQEAAALELIASSPYAFDPADIDWILAESQRWPALLQILCHVRLTALEFDEVGDGWQVEGKRQIESYAHLLTQ
jgi:hypothetical protein